MTSHSGSIVVDSGDCQILVLVVIKCTICTFYHNALRSEIVTKSKVIA